MNDEFKELLLMELVEYNWNTKNDLMMLLDTLDTEYPHNATKDVLKTILIERCDIDRVYELMADTNVKVKTISKLINCKDNSFFNYLERVKGIQCYSYEPNGSRYTSVCVKLSDVSNIIEFFNEIDFNNKQLIKIRLTARTREGIYIQLKNLGLENNKTLTWSDWTQTYGEKLTFQIADILSLV